MLSTFFYIFATLLLCLNFIRPFGIAISDWLFFFSFLSAIFETLILKKKFFSIWTPGKIFLWPVLLITLGGIISLTNSKYLSVAIVEVLQTIYVMTIFISLTWIMVRRGKVELIISVFIISGVFSAAIAAIDYFIGTHYGSLLSGTPYKDYILMSRYTGPLGHPNKFGYFLVLSTILTFYKLLGKRERKSNYGFVIIYIIAILVQCLGIYLSGSVTAYVGILFGFVFLLYNATPERFRKALYSLGFLLVISALVLNIFWNHSITSIQFEIPENSLIGVGINRVLNTTVRIRMDSYKQSIDYIVKNPFIGAGFDQSAASSLLEGERDFVGSIHNPFLQMWCIGGLFAFLGWLILHFSMGKIAVVNLLNSSKNQFNLRIFLSSTVLALIIMDQFQNSIYEREKWLVVGLLVSCNWVNKKMKNTYRTPLS